MLTSIFTAFSHALINIIYAIAFKNLDLMTFNVKMVQTNHCKNFWKSAKKSKHSNRNGNQKLLGRYSKTHSHSKQWPFSDIRKSETDWRKVITTELSGMVSVILIFGRGRRQIFCFPLNLTASLPAESLDQSRGDKAEEWISAVLEV